MARQLERDWEGERNELLNKAAEERRRGREGSALCLEHMAKFFEDKLNQKYIEQYQE